MAKQTRPIEKDISDAPQAPDLLGADEGVIRAMMQWLAHLRSERRLSPKTVEAYARDLRQCLQFLCTH
ncbi:site-specific integrase, partial [Bradyrhizobium sp.]